MPIVEQWCPPLACCDPTWEAAYERFESPAEEIQKFEKRLLSLGAASWPRDAVIVDLFCGRGNGLRALESLGFSQLSGVDLSESLLRLYNGPANLFVGDCRNLKLPDQSVDIVIVQGGLHHLPDFPGDLEKTLCEIRRVLRPTGRFVAVEPWNTTFLKTVHAFCNMSFARRLWGKLDALATMIDRERTTYEQWLNHPNEIRGLLQENFSPQKDIAAWGKLNFVGRPKPLKK